MAAKEEDELFEIMSSYSEPNDSETQNSNSETSEDDISETSEDRAFVVSDGDQSPYSNRSSGSSDYSQHCPDVQDNDSSDLIGQKIPIGTIARRVIHQGDSSAVQYLVLWRSWEPEQPHGNALPGEKDCLMQHLMLQVIERPLFSHWRRANGKQVHHVDRSSKSLVVKAPFIYSKTEELVWKWEQSKLCGQSINTILSSTTVPQGHPPNKADSRDKLVSIENGVVHVFPQAQLTNLEPHNYQLGILETADSANPKIILLGAKKENQKESLRSSLIRIRRSLLETVRPVFSSWSTEFWVSDSVVIDSKMTEEAGLVLKAVRAESLDEPAYVCVGLPVTIFGPLFNTLISKWNASVASFEYSNGFIWIYSAVDPTNFKIHASESDTPTNLSVSSMLQRMSGKSWLVRAKLVFRLERSSTEKAAILAEILQVSHIQVTSSHKPITHS
ncbi:hypothetical protein MYU51_021211 [Penicillium brevicompactum]